MPIVLVSVDSLNNRLPELVDLVDKFDIVYLANTQEATDLFDNISKKIQCDHTYFLEDLKPDLEDTGQEVQAKFNSVLNRFNSLKTGNVLIVSHHEFFNKVEADLINDEWETVSLIKKDLPLFS